MAWYESILDATKEVGKWMEENPTASKILSGAVVGGATYLGNKELQESQQSYQDKIYERQKADGLALSKASTGSNYDSHTNGLTGGTGLLTNGLLATKG